MQKVMIYIHIESRSILLLSLHELDMELAEVQDAADATDKGGRRSQRWPASPVPAPAPLEDVEELDEERPLPPPRAHQELQERLDSLMASERRGAIGSALPAQPLPAPVASAAGSQVGTAGRNASQAHAMVHAL